MFNVNGNRFDLFESLTLDYIYIYSESILLTINIAATSHCKCNDKRFQIDFKADIQQNTQPRNGMSSDDATDLASLSDIHYI